MSADNAIAIKRVGDAWKVKMVFLSDDDYDTTENFRDAESFRSEQEALAHAVKLEREDVVEYGVIKL